MMIIVDITDKTDNDGYSIMNLSKQKSIIVGSTEHQLSAYDVDIFKDDADDTLLAVYQYNEFIFYTKIGKDVHIDDKTTIEMLFKDKLFSIGIPNNGEHKFRYRALSVGFFNKDNMQCIFYQ